MSQQEEEHEMGIPKNHLSPMDGQCAGGRRVDSMPLEESRENAGLRVCTGSPPVKCPECGAVQREPAEEVCGNCGFVLSLLVEEEQ